MNGCANNPKISSTTKIGEHIYCAHSISTIGTFDNIENEHNLYRGKDCIKKFCTFLREHSTINKKRVKITLKCNRMYICGKRFLKQFGNDKNYQKVRDHCHFTGKYKGASHNICNLKFNVPNEIHEVFHNGSNCDYHFIINELAHKFEGKFKCLGENTEHYKNFLLK